MVTKDTYIKELKDIMVDKVSALIVIFGAIYGPLLGLFRQNEAFRMMLVTKDTYIKEVEDIMVDKVSNFLFLCQFQAFLGAFFG